MRQFYTPPMSNPKFDNSLSIKESYKPRQSGLETLGEHIKEEKGEKDEVETSDASVSLTQEEIDESLASIGELPIELSRLIDSFIADLKQPKYVSPLTIIQLASLFQGFYIKFDKSSFQYLTNDGTVQTSNGSFFSARENLSTGLSGIFARSRSSSTVSAKSLTRGPRRSSSLFSMESNSNGNVTQLLSPEEIKRHLKLNEINDLKIEKLMKLCEDNIFKKLLEVGISVSSQVKSTSSTSINTISSVRSHDKVHSNEEIFNVSGLFRNTPEYGDYDKLLAEKLRCLSKLSLDGKINLDEFLGIPSKVDLTNESKNEEIHKCLTNFTYFSISPWEKVQILMKIHDTMTYSKEMSNDEFLSMLIYYIIKFRPRKLFLNAEYTKLFRYKKKLVQKELYTLTNLEAALMFIEGLTLVDFSDELQKELTEHERKTLECKVSDIITLPPRNGKTINNPAMLDISSASVRQHLGQNSNLTDSNSNRSNSNDGFRNTFDSSLRNIIGKIRSYTPPTVSNLKPMPLPRSSSQLSMEYDRASPIRSINSGNNTSTNENQECNTGSLTSYPSSNEVIQDSWKKFKNHKFEDLKIQDLKEVFEIYQKLVE